ncbi:hypothetical protein PROFUN_00276 [Planoprotostelium fungivorum]|uniref:Uncharacterized protein n=1 Tax=Planoprotostelium fungivorum TaxID=1890364 RepID=A0A2P6NY14_9EUKA|nr:hypothetical protein PROFUN_00276 [Planoprotostelium fungivorum]
MLPVKTVARGGFGIEIRYLTHPEAGVLGQSENVLHPTLVVVISLEVSDEVEGGRGEGRPLFGWNRPMKDKAEFLTMEY